MLANKNWTYQSFVVTKIGSGKKLQKKLKQKSKNV
jgi:hypothetical protein